MDFDFGFSLNDRPADSYLSHWDPLKPQLRLQIITVTDCRRSERIKRELRPMLIYWCARLNAILGWIELSNYDLLPGLGLDFLEGNQIKSYPMAFVMPERLYQRQHQFTRTQLQSTLSFYESRFDHGTLIQSPQASNLTLTGILKLVAYYPYTFEYARAMDLPAPVGI